MRTHRKGFLALILIAYTIAVTSGYCFWYGQYEAISAWAVSLTGGVVLWYTWETMLLRRAAHSQLELQLRPFVVVERLERQFQIRNLGQGTALNIKLDDVVVDSQEQIIIRFPGVTPILPHGETKTIEVACFHGDSPVGDFFSAHLDPQHAVLDLLIKVNFQNIERKPYLLSQSVGPGKVEIIGASESV